MIKEEGKFKWIEEGKGGHPIILLHGLMGGCDNFGEMVDFISEEYHVYGLDLKLFKGRLLKVSVKDLSNYLYKFMNQLGIKSAVLIGNSMGGHIALIFAKDHPEMVDGMILTGSSGLFENSLGSSFPRRGDKDYIRTKAEEVFYDPKVATDEYLLPYFANRRFIIHLSKINKFKPDYIVRDATQNGEDRVNSSIYSSIYSDSFWNVINNDPNIYYNSYDLKQMTIKNDLYEGYNIIHRFFQ